MRVLWFTNTPSLAAPRFNLPVVGGGWIQSLESAIRNEPGIELGIAFRLGEDSLQPIEENGTKYYAIPTHRKGRLEGFLARHRGSIDDKGFLDYCLRVVNDFKPDIIHIFGTEDAFGLIAPKVAVPVVIHLQGLLTVYERKWFSPGVSKKEMLQESGLKDRIKANSLYHVYKKFRTAARREQQIFAGCKNFMGRTAWDHRLSMILSPGSRYFHCEEALRREFYPEQWNPATRNEKIIVSTIQSNIYKGLETVLEAAALLKKNQFFPFRWLIAGISDEDRMIRIFEKKTGLRFQDNNITLCGSVGVKELIQMEKEADLFVHPSHIDNSPNSVCEAMLLGMPVIATATGGTGSLLTDGVEGLLIQDGDPWAMAGAILELVQQPERAAAMGSRARARAAVRHDHTAIVKQVLQVYKEIQIK